MTIEDMIKSIVNKEFLKLSSQLNERVFNTREAAEYLRVSTDWMYKNLDNIPHSDIGGYKFLKSQLDYWVKCKSQKHNTIETSSNSKCTFKVK